MIAAMAVAAATTTAIEMAAMCSSRICKKGHIRYRPLGIIGFSRRYISVISNDILRVKMYENKCFMQN